ncbi:MAG: hypothetical protein D6761_12505 [Candidatus Dadabacteria bacterium]|nr:MAG: hypothetical protein D6761_12505 [Candidatus Dadabacteria bacterium]
MFHPARALVFVGSLLLVQLACRDVFVLGDRRCSIIAEVDGEMLLVNRDCSQGEQEIICGHGEQLDVNVRARIEGASEVRFSLPHNRLNLECSTGSLLSSSGRTNQYGPVWGAGGSNCRSPFSVIKPVSQQYTAEVTPATASVDLVLEYDVPAEVTSDCDGVTDPTVPIRCFDEYHYEGYPDDFYTPDCPMPERNWR